MAIDLEIVTPDIDLGIFKKLLGEKTHFIYELVQNADDSKSNLLGLRLYKNELFVWNDGRPFSQEDVQSICSTGSSDKDLTQIGNFGIGFKSVYNYTDLPEIYSNDVCFRIPYLKKPEAIDMDPRVAELLNKNVTVVFRLPFKDSLLPEDITNLENHLYTLEKKRSLLFLRHLKTIQWYDEKNGQTGSYVCLRPDKPGNRFQVELRASLNGESQLSETFLVFRKEVQPQENIIDRLQDQAENLKEEDRIQRSRAELQFIEVAFKLQDGKITTLDGCILFAYLPTEIKTNLRFLIQARYQTTPSRENIVKPSESLWNRWLVKETSQFLPEVLEELKGAGLLEPAFFNVLPLKGEVENEFKPIAEALQKAMRERAFVPTKGGGYAKAETVFYPHRESLLQDVLIESSWLYPGSSWLHQDIGLSGHAFNVMKEAGVKEINVSQVLNWLQKQDLNWFENKDEKWLRSLYVYLNTQKSQLERIKGLERIKKLPLVRLENGQHVSAGEAFFPPGTDEAREEVAPLLNDLPILQSALLKGEDHNDVKPFLEDLGVEVLHPENLINKSICPLYNQLNKPSIMKNRRHVRYIFKCWQKSTGSERSRLKENISKVPILQAYKSIQREISDFVVPCNAYLPQAYTGDDDLETYFSMSGSDVWFVDGKYLTNKSDTKTWLRFLKAIGAMDTPQITDMEVSGSSEECKKRSITYEYSTRPFENGKVKDIWFRRPYEYFDGHIIDRSFDGLSEVLAQIGNHSEIDLPKALWGLLVKLVSSLPSEEWKHYSFFKDCFQGIYRWAHRGEKQKFFDAAFYCQLKKTAWLPDEQGNLHSPDKCFLPTSKNQEILGDSVTYLHPDFDVSTRPAQWLAEKLGVHLEADAEGVLDYLQTLSQTETSIEKVKPIYKFLESEDIDLWKFEEEPLIFTPGPGSRWWRTSEVFWVNESPVFGDYYGYLADYYGDPLKGFFRGLGVQKRAAPSDYIRVIRDIASAEVPEDSEVRERVKILYNRLWLSLQENGNLSEDEEWQEEWEQVHAEACWLGRKGDEWGFYLLEKLVWNDHNYCAEVVEGKVPFWEFGDDLLEFAKHLGVEGCYEASNIEFDCYSDQGECTIESEKVQKLVPYIHDFLNSTPWRGVYSEEEMTEILGRLSVRRAQKLEVNYELKGIPIPDPDPRQSFLDTKSEGTILWLGLEESEGAYPDLIGDALQDYFGINELREFIKDLLLTTDPHRTTLLNWERRGFEPDRCLAPPELNSKEDEKKSPDPVDNEFPDETGNGDDSGTNDCDIETPAANENTGIGNRSPDSTNGSGNPSEPSGTGPSGGHWGGTSSGGGSSAGGHGGRGGGGEGEEHRVLKEYLADNPSQLGAGLKPGKKEHKFESGDRVDILLQDRTGKPVTVEVETHIPSGNYVGVWQAVKYQHLAAMEYNLECRQVRSILAAPEIPDDVKEKCKELGIEPFEVSQE